MKRLLIALSLALGCCAGSLLAQREFLTNDEIEKIREAQEPNDRLQMYILFARQRLDQLQQQITKDKKGRSLAIRELLEDYTSIIDAIDTVSDDALKRKVDLAAGVKAVADAEEKFIAQLKKIESNPPRDFEMYNVALKDALGSTTDSLETTREDLATRTQAVVAKSEREKKEVESLSTPERIKEQKAEEAKVDDGKPKRKPPTLYRPGEKPESPK